MMSCYEPFSITIHPEWYVFRGYHVIQTKLCDESTVATLKRKCLLILRVCMTIIWPMFVFNMFKYIVLPVGY